MCNLSGFGFEGYDQETGKGKWNKVTNVYPSKTECSSSLKLLIDNWNVGTALWLRRFVIPLSPKLGGEIPYYKIAIIQFMTVYYIITVIIPHMV